MFTRTECAGLDMEGTTKKSVLSPKLGGGPHGLGDPNDQSLRKVELEVMIPKKMRDRARVDKCFSETEAFSKCCKDTGIAMVVKCRTENSALKGCLEKWYNDETFKRECTEEYLKERSEYRRTGKKQKS